MGRCCCEDLKRVTGRHDARAPQRFAFGQIHCGWVDSPERSGFALAAVAGIYDAATVCDLLHRLKQEGLRRVADTVLFSVIV
jgi:hypothetical protein